jgi:hypothetical protein
MGIRDSAGIQRENASRHLTICVVARIPPGHQRLSGIRCRSKKTGCLDDVDANSMQMTLTLPLESWHNPRTVSPARTSLGSRHNLGALQRSKSLWIVLPLVAVSQVTEEEEGKVCVMDLETRHGRAGRSRSESAAERLRNGDRRSVRAVRWLAGIQVESFFPTVGKDLTCRPSMIGKDEGYDTGRYTCS